MTTRKAANKGKTTTTRRTAAKPAAKSVKKKTVKKKVASVKSKPKERRTRARKPYKSPLGLDVMTLEKTFKLLEPNIDEVVARFYDELFSRYPAVIPMFQNTSKAAQAKKLET